MANYLKINSSIPEFYVSFQTITETPEGYMDVSDQDLVVLQAAIDANIEGSVVSGIWVAN